MTKIARMKTLNNAEDFIKLIKDKELFIYEDIQGSKIYFNWDGEKVNIKPKSLKSDTLNSIDLTLQNYYNFAYDYFHSLPDYVYELLNKKWWFCFEYFPDNQPANIEYNRVPKNNLILTCVVKNNKFIYNYDEIIEYSKLFNVDSLPILFKGKLSDKQLTIIELYLNTSERDLKYVFEEDNFAYFFYKLLNPMLDNSFLMKTNNFNDNLEKIVFKIDGEHKYSFEILNPMYNQMELTNNTEYVETYSLILLKFIEFIQTIDFNNYDIKYITKDEIYIELICNIFNDYINKNGKYLNDWDLIIPNFFKENKFKINLNYIYNDKTLQSIKYNVKLEYIFKSILGSFLKKKKKPIGIFKESTLTLFNNTVDDITKFIDEKLQINKENILNQNTLKNFKDYFDLKFSRDLNGDIYPDFYKEFTEEEGGEDKKDGKKGDKTIISDKNKKQI